MGPQRCALAPRGLAPPGTRQSASGGAVVLTPKGVELASPSARTTRQAAKAPRASRSAVYVAYRRRSASGKIRVATGLLGREAR